MQTNVGETEGASLYSSHDEDVDDDSDEDEDEDEDGGDDSDDDESEVFAHTLTSFTPALIIPAISRCPSSISTSAT